MAIATRPPTSRRSVFNARTLQDVIDEIQRVYLRYSIPFVIAYSGGKDSTLALLLWWLAIAALPTEQRTKPIHIISSNTGVEQPDLIARLKTSLVRINQAANVQGLPFEAVEVGPPIIDSFLVCLIGKRWSAPQQTTRWCTTRLKTQPNTRYVKSVIADNGRCIVVLGVRADESVSWAESIERHRVPGSLLGINGELRGAYTYAPVVDFTSDDVWTVLLQQHLTPWGDDNHELLTMYRQSGGGDCPIIVGQVDRPSCGTGRMGCWVCPLPTRNASLESLVDRHEYLEPLMDFYLLLKRTTVPANKLEYRDWRRSAAGEILMGTRSKQPTPGKYLMPFAQRMLRELLTAQQSIREDGPDPQLTLITIDELHAINHLWRHDPYYPQDRDVALEIYAEVTGETLPPWSAADGALLERPQLRKPGSDLPMQLSLDELFAR
ncbi:MAG: DNA phosphorothioation system sulfurtransferase DndC [Chloroflexota bacterium]|nr:DNA phosphorothioation system sulfurtransferase DndC [Chloroflexota bacterium]